MKLAHIILVVATTLLTIEPSAHADIYECVGKDGATHYGTSKKRGMRCKLKYGSKRKSRHRTASGSYSVVRSSKARASSKPRLSEAQNWLKYGEHIREAARRYSLPQSLIRAVCRVESRFTPTALSRVGAMGMMQLMPRTARAMGVTEPQDPRQNILGGARYLRILANKFGGDVVLTLAAYNAGEGAVRKYGGIPPYAETQRYVRRVLHHYFRYRSNGMP